MTTTRFSRMTRKQLESELVTYEAISEAFGNQIDKENNKKNRNHDNHNPHNRNSYQIQRHG